MTVRIDKPPDAAVFNRLRDPGVSAVASLLTHFGAAKIEVNLKRENRGFISLSVDHVRAFIDRVIGRADVRESMRTLSVKGKREDTDNLEAVDLIEDRLSFEGYVEYDAQRRLDPVACESLLIGALENNEAELRRREP